MEHKAQIDLTVVAILGVIVLHGDQQILLVVKQLSFKNGEMFEQVVCSLGILGGFLVREMKGSIHMACIFLVKYGSLQRFPFCGYPFYPLSLLCPCV